MVTMPLIIIGICIPVIILCLLALYSLSKGNVSGRNNHGKVGHKPSNQDSGMRRNTKQGNCNRQSSSPAPQSYSADRSMTQKKETAPKAAPVHEPSVKPETKSSAPTAHNPSSSRMKTGPEKQGQNKVIVTEEKFQTEVTSNNPSTPQKRDRQEPDTLYFSSNGFDLLSCSVQGESHIASGKECQDFSRCWEERNTRICIVSDGHGGDRYFRSRIGAEKAVYIAYDTIKQFLWEDRSSDIIKGIGFTSFGIANERTVCSEQDRQIVSLFDQLFRSIISQWHEAIEIDARHNPTNEWENSNVKQEYRQQLNELRDVEKIYGCTLMAYVQTDRLWFAFQIGDGKVVALDVNNNCSSEPIPWDDQCFLNKTTSMCGSHASEEFRFCCQGDGHFPCAVFLGSDGIDDTFRTDRDLADFYIKLGRYCIEHGCKEAASEIEVSLPVLSKRGSQDDMTVSFLLNRKGFVEYLPALLNEELLALDEQIHETEIELNDLKNKANSLTSKTELTENEQINLQYHLKDIGSKEDELFRLKEKRSKLKTELEIKR